MENCKQSSVRDPAASSGAQKRPRSPTSDKEPHPKRKRTMFTDEQLIQLSEYFAENKTPTTPQIVVMAANTGLKVKVVQTYFRNRRKELKKQQREAASQTPAPVDDEYADITKMSDLLTFNNSSFGSDLPVYETKKEQREAESRKTAPLLNFVICFPDTPEPARQKKDSIPSVIITIPRPMDHQLHQPN